MALGDSADADSIITITPLFSLCKRKRPANKGFLGQFWYLKHLFGLLLQTGGRYMVSASLCRGSLVAIYGIAIQLFPGVLAAQESQAGPWSGTLGGGLTLHTGESHAVWFALSERVAGRWSSVALEIDGNLAFHFTRETEREHSEDGEVTERRETTTVDIYDISPTLRWTFDSPRFVVVDYDWKRDPTQGIEHLSFVSGGVGVGTQSPDGSGSRSLELRAGYLFERESDGDRLNAPMAAIHFKQARTFQSKASADGSFEVVSNLADLPDLRCDLQGRLSAPLTSHLSLSVHLHLTFRNRATELLIDPVNRQRSYSVEGLRSSLTTSFTYSL